MLENDNEFDFISDPLVIHELRGSSNIEVVERTPCPIQYDCVFYFSSNGLYFPNTKLNFQKIVVDIGSFEWKNSYFLKSKKNIYLRDVRKQWYWGGINESIKNLEFLIHATKNMASNSEFATVGSSAGGYAAALIGALNGAKVSICFNAQFNLKDEISKEKNKILSHYKSEYKKFIFLKRIIENIATKCLYIYSFYSKIDRDQADYIMGTPNVIMLPIRSKRHGVPIPSKCLPYIDFCNINKSECKPITPIGFVCKYSHKNFKIINLSLYMESVVFNFFRKILRNI